MSEPDFSRPPEEVTRFLAAKGVKPSWSWRDFSFDEHAHAFTVAKSAGFDILQDIKGELEKAIAGHMDFEEFRKNLEPLLKAKGWWGQKHLPDPLTGEVKKVQLGSARRLRTIHWANTRTAYGAGQWERARRTREVLPYLVYVISTAEKKRPLHMSWVGTMLPVEHPWWSTHYPPSAWGCMCRVRQASQSEAEASGYVDDQPAPDDGYTSFTNRRTGEVVQVPRGVDPGWGQNPGQQRLKQASDLLAGKLDAMDAEARRIAAVDLSGSWLFRRFVAGEIPYDAASADIANVARGKLSVPFAVLPEAVAAALGADTRVLRLSLADAQRLAQAQAGAGGEAASDYAVVQRLLDQPESVETILSGVMLRGTVDGAAWRLQLRRDTEAAGAVFLESLTREPGGH